MFIYSKNFEIYAYDPPHAFIDPSSTTDTTIKVLGRNFLPINGNTYCLLNFATPIKVPATYINNHTMSCEIPPHSNPYSLNIEISLNGGN